MGLQGTRSVERRAVAWLAGLGLVVGIVWLPMTSAHGSSATTTVTSGTISWGVKSSFRRYVTGAIAHGSITVTAPATDDGTRTTFSQARGQWSEAEAEVTTAGAVRFTGHSGQLDLTISQPRLVLTSSDAAVVVDAVDSGGRRHANLKLALLDLNGAATVSGTSVTVTNAKATLTAAGTALFMLDGAAFYPAGAPLDPVSAAFELDAAASGSESASPSASVPPGWPAPTPSSSQGNPRNNTPTSHPGPHSTTADAAKAGYLRWGVKSSFRDYVIGPIAKGSITTSGGAVADGAGYQFGQSRTTADPPAAAGNTSYSGAVRFAGHHGALDLTFRSPILRITGRSTAVLSLEVSGFGRLNVASVALNAATRQVGPASVAYSGAPTTLTAAGSKVFSYVGSSFYPPGTAMDPLTFRIGAASTAHNRPAATTVHASASAAPSTSVTAPTAIPEARCPARDARLVWGFKETFRAYVSGSIAEGDWTTSGKASYRTPDFTWAEGSGTYDSNSGLGQVAFRGAVSFTGHHGALDTVLSDPSIRFVSPTKAVLTLDFASTSMEAAMAGKTDRTKATAVPFVELDLGRAKKKTQGTGVAYVEIPSTLTTQGAAVFSNYAAGTAFDPVSLEFEAAECAPADASVAADAKPAAAGGQSQVPPWLGWAGSSIVGSLIGSAAVLFAGRKGWVRL